MRRSELHEIIEHNKDQLIMEVLVTSIRKSYFSKDHVVVRDLLEVEIAQVKSSELFHEGFANEHNERMVVYDRLLFATPDEVLKALPNLKISSEKLEALLRSRSSDREDPEIYILIEKLGKIHLSDDKDTVTPILTIIELTETDLDDYFAFLSNHEYFGFYEKKNLELLSNGENCVDPKSGEKIYRIIRTQFVEDFPGDIIIKDKVLESEYKRLLQSKDILGLKKEEQLKGPQTYLFFDTETTGLPKRWNASVTEVDNWPRLVQLAYSLYDEHGNHLLKNSFIIKPKGFTIPVEVSNIHRITTYKANAEGQDIAEVLKDFIKLLSNADFLVAHNLAFDEKVLCAEFLRLGYQNPFFKMNKICTMEQTTNFCALPGLYGYKWPKLSDLYTKLFRMEFEEAHDAAVDVEATAKCFWELRKFKRI